MTISFALAEIKFMFTREIEMHVTCEEMIIQKVKEKIL